MSKAPCYVQRKLSRKKSSRWFGASVKRSVNHFRRHHVAPTVHKQRGTSRRESRRYIRHTNVLAHCGTQSARGYFSNDARGFASFGSQHGIAMPGGASGFHLEAHQTAGHARGLLGSQRFAANEAALVQFYHPTQTSFVRGRFVGQVIAIKRQLC